MGEILLALINLMEKFRDFFIPWTVIDQYEEGVMLRLGKFREHKGRKGVLGPGIWFHLPFNIDVVLKTNVVFETGSSELSVTTKDGIDASMEIVIGFTINNVKKFLLELEGGEDAVLAIIGGTASEVARTGTWEQLSGPDSVSLIEAGIGRRAVRFGVRVEQVYFHGLNRMGLEHGVLKFQGIPVPQA